MTLSDVSKQSLVNLLDSLVLDSRAKDYLAGRGLTQQAVGMFRLGVVPSTASAEWSRFQGMLALPYHTVTGPVAVKFRRLDGGQPKYDGPAGQKVGLFNAIACMDPGNQIVITEGEIDAITLHAECGIPAVGIPGVGNWKRYYRRCVDGFNDVIIMTDNDAKENGSNPGLELAIKIKESVPHARVIHLPPGEDVNSFFVRHGASGVSRLIS